MAIPVLILGESGTGKSASLRNFKADELKVINVEGKPLPFKNKFEIFNSDNYVKILKEMQATKKSSIIIDDAQYLMANEFMRRATERGFDKFTEIAQNFWNLVNKVKELPKNQIVYFLAHIERDANGNEKIKTIGKLLDEKITVEGMFTIVLKTNVTDGQYTFITQNNGHDTVKSPIGMFPSVAIDNDLKYVDDKIRNYYEIGDFKTDEEMAVEDNAVKAEIPQEEKKSRRGRRAVEKKEDEPEQADKETVEEEASESTRTEEHIDDTAPTDGVGTEEEKPTRRRRNLTEEKKQATEQALKELAQNGCDTEDETQDDAVPFEDVETPDVTPLPRRRRRESAPIEETPVESVKAVNEENNNDTESQPTRRRRRRV
jgi:hypothetical protein